MTWLIFAGIALLFLLPMWAIGVMDVGAEIDREKRSEHHHDYQRVGYGGAGWSVYECACGAKEIDA